MLAAIHRRVHDGRFLGIRADQPPLVPVFKGQQHIPISRERFRPLFQRFAAVLRPPDRIGQIARHATSAHEGDVGIDHVQGAWRGTVNRRAAGIIGGESRSRSTACRRLRDYGLPVPSAIRGVKQGIGGLVHTVSPDALNPGVIFSGRTDDRTAERGNRFALHHRAPRLASVDGSHHLKDAVLLRHRPPIRFVVKIGIACQLLRNRERLPRFSPVRRPPMGDKALLAGHKMEKSRLRHLAHKRPVLAAVLGVIQEAFTVGRPIPGHGRPRQLVVQRKYLFHRTFYLMLDAPALSCVVGPRDPPFAADPARAEIRQPHGCHVSQLGRCRSGWSGILPASPRRWFPCRGRRRSLSGTSLGVRIGRLLRRGGRHLIGAGTPREDAQKHRQDDGKRASVCMCHNDHSLLLSETHHP